MLEGVPAIDPRTDVCPEAKIPFQAKPKLDSRDLSSNVELPPTCDREAGMSNTFNIKIIL